MLMVVICFQISIFDTIGNNYDSEYALKIAVVICFQISIFDTIGNNTASVTEAYLKVVICFQISIFDTIGNNFYQNSLSLVLLWFAFKLVSLIPLETTVIPRPGHSDCCDLLSN